MKTKSLGFIGGGRITRIILHAIGNKTEFKSIVVYDTNAAILEELRIQYPSITLANSVLEPAQQDIVFIALHPPVIIETLHEVKDKVRTGSVIISLAPKITLQKMSEILPHVKNIVRLIPNATSIINEGYNPVSFSETMSEWKKQTILSLLRRMGHTFEVPENKLESYAIMSAMLPTYFWFQWKELIEIGCKVGLSEEESLNSVRDTMLAALRTYFYAGLTSDQVIDLIPVKPIGDKEADFKAVYQEKLIPLFQKIKP